MSCGFPSFARKDKDRLVNQLRSRPQHTYLTKAGRHPANFFPGKLALKKITKILEKIQRENKNLIKTSSRVSVESKLGEPALKCKEVRKRSLCFKILISDHLRKKRN